MQITHELMNEHQLILKYLDLMEKYVEFSQANDDKDLLLEKAQDFISFIQKFTDTYHQYKRGKCFIQIFAGTRYSISL